MDIDTARRPSTDDAGEGDRRVSAWVGLIAAAVGLGLGEAAAGIAGLTSPVTAVGDVVVDVVPEPVKQMAITLFGTADKIALQVGIVVLLAFVALGIGRLARRRLGLALAATAGFGVVGVASVLAAPESGVLDLLPSVVAGTAAVGTLWLLAAPASAVPGPVAERRSLLRAAVGGLVVAASGVVVGRLASSSRAASLEQARRATSLPSPTDAVDVPADLGLDVDGVSPFVTSNADFYRIDTRLDTPRLAREGWQLTVTGMVAQPMTLSLEELEDRYEVIERAITMTCVSNEVGGGLVGTARWLGVRLADVLDDAAVDPGATQLVGRAFDDFTTGFPVEAAFDRDAMLVVGMNGEPLPPAHGFPLRLVVPGLYGYVSATKWLTELELTTFEEFDQYWVRRGWVEEAPIRTQSRIDTPGGFDSVSGVVPVAGVAWAQTRGIDRVEVRVDDGDWQEAELGPAFNDVTWRQWVFRWDTGDAGPGRHDLTVRATDATGETQPEERQEPFPSGATGWHTVVVTVAEDDG